MLSNNNPMQSFKSLNRQKPPAWSNRFRKDVNDLMYSPKDLRDIGYAKKSPQNKTKADNSKRVTGTNSMKNAMEKYNIQAYKSSVHTKGQHKRSYSSKFSNDLFVSKSSQLFRTQKNDLYNPESSKLKQKIYQNPKIQPLLRTTDAFMKRSQSMKNISNRIQSSNNFGLSQFEFSTKTIQGKIHAKQNHHLDYSKSRTQKINNVHPIYYNKDQDILLYEHEKRKIIETLRKYRNFKSYSPHKLYITKEGVGNGGFLDIFYEVRKDQLDLVKKKCSLELDFKKLTPRPEMTKKLGTNLDYPKSYTEIAKLNTTRPLYDIQKEQRNLVISKQVIYDKRGCYR